MTFMQALRNGAIINQLGKVRRKSNSVQPLGNLSTVKTNRYQERAKARDTLKKLDIIDLNSSPSSIMSHSMLTRDNQSVDLIDKSLGNSRVKLESFGQNHGSYTRRELSQKIDLEMTLL